MELAFVAANGIKIPHGGWFPLAAGSLILVVMITWRAGRQVLRAKLAESYLPFDLFLQDIATFKVPRVPGTAVFLSGNPGGTPIALLHNLRHNKVMHERVIVLTIITEDVPRVPRADRIRLETVRTDIHRIIAHYGFMEQPNVPALLAQCSSLGLQFNPAETTYFVSRETIVPHRGRGMARWRRRLFGALSRNAQPVTAFFQLTPNRVVELGMQVEI
jgi:KUP system potassium uptake protein